MKIRKRYILFINGITCTAFYGGNNFNYRLGKPTLGNVFDCTLTELKTNIKLLEKKNFTVLKMKH